MKDWNELAELVREFEHVQASAQAEELNILLHQIHGLVERIDLSIAQQLFKAA